MKNEINENPALSKMAVRRCASCHTENPDKGRALDGRRAYRCKFCGNVWTEGMQGREKKYDKQRHGFQFSNSIGHGHIA